MSLEEKYTGDKLTAENWCSGHNTYVWNCGCRKTLWSNLEVHMEKVNQPPHYTQGTIECIQAIESSMTTEQFKGFLKGNVLKYVWRSDHKNKLEDLEKAKWYLERLISVSKPSKI